jgi:glycolate oxidase iron-sulfur subunit
MRSVQFDNAPVTDEFVEFIDTCVQCRGCEPACPSGVQFGHLMEATRATLAAEHRITPRWQRAGFAVLAHHRLLLAGSTLLAYGQRLRLVPRRLGIPKLPVRRPPRLAATGADVWFFTGCVMDAWLRDVHQATARVLAACGVSYALPDAGGSCCGALHVHAGLHEQSVSLAERVMASMPGDAPIVVNSAGCGAALKDYGHLVGTTAAREFAARVVDVHEFVATRLDRLELRRRADPIIVQDPCHLRHVQRTHQAVRTVLGVVADLIELDDDGLCCGAGGAYSALQPELAGAIRDRKIQSITRAGGGLATVLVASANPGCALHLQAVGAHVQHPMQILAACLK